MDSKSLVNTLAVLLTETLKSSKVKSLRTRVAGMTLGIMERLTSSLAVNDSRSKRSQLALRSSNSTLMMMIKLMIGADLRGDQATREEGSFNMSSLTLME